MQVDFREALLDATEELLEPVDLQVGVQPTLHQNAGTAIFHGFADLVVDGVEVEDVSLGGHLALERTVEGAESAVLGAEIRVVDVAVDDVGDHALGVLAATHRVRIHADTDQVFGAEHVNALLFG